MQYPSTHTQRCAVICRTQAHTCTHTRVTVILCLCIHAGNPAPDTPVSFGCFHTHFTCNQQKLLFCRLLSFSNGVWICMCEFLHMHEYVCPYVHVFGVGVWGYVSVCVCVSYPLSLAALQLWTFDPLELFFLLSLALRGLAAEEARGGWKTKYFLKSPGLQVA